MITDGGDDDVDDDAVVDDDDDVDPEHLWYWQQTIMMQSLCVCVCHEKSSLPTSG